MLARWDDAVPLLEESYATNPSQPGSYRIGLFLYHFAHGRFAEALGEARRVNAPQVLYGHVAVAAAAAELGLHDEAEEAVAAIRALDPDYGAHVVADLEGRHVAPEVVPLIVAGLAKAGLAVAEPAAAGRRPSGPSSSAPAAEPVMSASGTVPTDPGELRRLPPGRAPRRRAAGLAVAAVGLPSAIAYPAIAGLPPVTGLYASIAPLVAYAIFGPSRQLIVGPDAATMTVLAALLAAMPGLEAADRPGVAAMLALVVGGY